MFNEMPLKLVFSYEHFYYVKNGYDCKALHLDNSESLDDILKSL